MAQTRAPLLLCGDSMEELESLPDNFVDAVVTDPPYGLSFMGRAWDYQVPGKAVWQEVLRVMKPGAHLLAFFGSRTYHRGVVEIEDAGFEIRDCVMWVYGSGFPKSLDISKAIDKAAGVEFSSKPASGVGFMGPDGPGGYNVTKNQLTRIGETTPAAAQWSGWGTALKPAHEPIVLARKPLEGTVAGNVLRHGVGGLNVDGCRILTTDNLGGGAQLDQQAPKPEGWDRPWRSNPEAQRLHAERIRNNVAKAESLGRWPANLIHDGSDEVLALFPETRARGNITATKRNKSEGVTGWGVGKEGPVDPGDAGSAARFFYCVKASKSDRGEGNTHPTVKPQALMRYLCRLITPPNGLILDPFMGSGSTGVAAIHEGFRFAGIDREPDYVALSRKRIQQAMEAMMEAVGCS